MVVEEIPPWEEGKLGAPGYEDCCSSIRYVVMSSSGTQAGPTRVVAPVESDAHPWFRLTAGRYVVHDFSGLSAVAASDGMHAIFEVGEAGSEDVFHIWKAAP